MKVLSGVKAVESFIWLILPFGVALVVVGVENSLGGAMNPVTTRNNYPPTPHGWGSVHLRVLASLIVLDFTYLSVATMLNLHFVAGCDEKCLMNSTSTTIDFYGCLSRDELVRSTWEDNFVLVCPAVTISVALSSWALLQYRNHAAVAAAKLVYSWSAIFYVGYVSNYQCHFGIFSNVTLYAKLLAAVTVIATSLFLMSVFSETNEQLKEKVSLTFIAVYAMIFLHIGYSGQRLLCRNGGSPLTGYIFAHYFIVFSFALYNVNFPHHVVLATCLIVIPPMCPAVVALAAWCFDAIWSDLSKMSRTIWASQPSIPRIAPRERIYMERVGRRRENAGMFWRQTRFNHPIRGLS